MLIYNTIVSDYKMSSQKGNSSRTRPQKYKNKTAFKNNLHDTSIQTKVMNNIQVSDVCVRCKEIIEWKIKYKKYKPLTQPKKCVKCEQKTVKQAYHVMCLECGRKLQVCTKCCKTKEDIVTVPSKQEQQKLDAEMQQLLQSLPERKRRTFIRYMNKKHKDDSDNQDEKNQEKVKDDLVKKLNALKVQNEDDLDDFDFSDDELDSDLSEG